MLPVIIFLKCERMMKAPKEAFFSLICGNDCYYNDFITVQYATQLKYFADDKRSENGSASKIGEGN